MTTTAQARDAIMSLIHTAWLANPTSAPVVVIWDNVAGAKPGQVGSSEKAAPWVRFALRHNVGDQDTLAPIGRRRYLSGGIFTAQIFTAFGDGHQLGDALVAVVKAALRATSPSSPVWFSGIVVSEIGEDGPWFNINVDATFRYQERA